MIGGNYTQSVGTALTELLCSDDIDGVLGINPIIVTSDKFIAVDILIIW
jgi:hypothetical protein